MNLLLQVGLFVILYFAKVWLTFVILSLILRLSPYCVDRIIYTPFLIPVIYRDHAKSRRELPKDIAYELLLYFFMLLISFNSFVMFIRPLNSARLTLYMLMITFLLEFFLIVIHVGVFFFSIIFSPEKYAERIFIEENGEKNEKAFFNTDPFTTEESLQIFREIHLGPMVISLIHYYYNLSMTMINGAILIRRKIGDFLKSYGAVLFFIPMLVFFIFIARTSEPVEPDPDNVGKTVAEQLGLEAAYAGVYFIFLITIYLPVIGGLEPEVWFGIERQFYTHNGNCVCQKQKTQYKDKLRPILLQIKSWRNFEKQMSVK